MSFFIPVFVDTHLFWNPKLNAHEMEKAFTILIAMIFCVWETAYYPGIVSEVQNWG